MVKDNRSLVGGPWGKGGQEISGTLALGLSLHLLEVFPCADLTWQKLSGIEVTHMCLFARTFAPVCSEALSLLR